MCQTTPACGPRVKELLSLLDNPVSAARAAELLDTWLSLQTQEAEAAAGHHPTGREPTRP
ncbi:hypothetical protein PJ985_11135 [Streptomyces sp. ACA25]|uniref:hypothetical protein n=1 Tax=Streptomyces sp. ACA25 TaxID=3022596 RepID=UPI002307248D|nr:hypothetical protein [Streptomyces sp. ACA25]MDB1088117.1 hypothetical protein [Streptomyces sp. ACA25]